MMAKLTLCVCVNKQNNAEVRELAQRIEKLREDFNYNLALIDNRDEELARYDASFGQLQRELTDKDSLLQSSRGALSEAYADLKAERDRYLEVEAHWRQRLTELAGEMETTRSRHDEQTTRLREDLDLQRKETQKAALSHEEQMSRLRLELTDKSEQRILALEGEYRSRLHESETSRRQLEIQVRQQNSEMEYTKARERELLKVSLVCI